MNSIKSDVNNEEVIALTRVLRSKQLISRDVKSQTPSNIIFMAYPENRSSNLKAWITPLNPQLGWDTWTSYEYKKCTRNDCETGLIVTS